MLETVLGVVAALMPGARAWPQFVRIAVRKDVEGVSVLTWSMILANFTLWASYGVILELPVLIAANFIAGVASAGVLLSIARHGRTSIWRTPLLISGGVALAFAIEKTFGANAVLLVATTLAIVMFLPQVYTVFRTEPTGVSPLTWWLGIFSGIVWTAYAWLVDHPLIAAPHAVMVPCAIAILARLYTFKPAPAVIAERV